MSEPFLVAIRCPQCGAEPFDEKVDGTTVERYDVEAITSRDYCNGKVHLQGPLCDGLLSYGMHRAGLRGDYLPPPSIGEAEYWDYYHQTNHHERSHTVTKQAIDILR
jgi:hypothetical protein